jgi:hypothetical protein
MKLAHHFVWESVNGAIPEGYEIHHIDGDKHNNDIENLKLLTRAEHQKIHSPYFGILNGIWVRICKYCRTIDKPAKSSTCDECRARMARIDRRKARKGKL